MVTGNSRTSLAIAMRVIGTMVSGMALVVSPGRLGKPTMVRFIMTLTVALLIDLVTIKVNGNKIIELVKENSAGSTATFMMVSGSLTSAMAGVD
jgi:hypothetical protein